MIATDNLRYTKLALSNGAGAIPALGFGTLIPDPIATKNATKAALEAGFRALDTAERYRTEKEVGEAMKDVFKAGEIKRRMCMSPRNSGTLIIVLSASNRPSRRALRNSSSIISIFISSTPLSPSNLETSKTRGTPTAM